MKSHTLISLNGLMLGSFASGIGLFSMAAPAEAFTFCKGNSVFGSIQFGSGANCGALAPTNTFAIDVTDYFAQLANPGFADSQFGVAISSAGTTPVSFQNVQAVVKGTLGGSPFNGPIAIWGEDLSSAPFGLGDPNPFGPAFTDFTYSANPATKGPTPPGAFRSVDFSFNLGAPFPGAFGIFGSWKASPNLIALTSVESFLITGQLVTNGTGDPSESTIVSFGVGPAGEPDFDDYDNSFSKFGTFGGYFTTEAPGPLPIAGAGAAFAWSRKLRRKQKLGAGN